MYHADMGKSKYSTHCQSYFRHLDFRHVADMLRQYITQRTSYLASTDGTTVRHLLSTLALSWYDFQENISQLWCKKLVIKSHTPYQNCVVIQWHLLRMLAIQNRPLLTATIQSLRWAVRWNDGFSYWFYPVCISGNRVCKQPVFINEYSASLQRQVYSHKKHAKSIIIQLQRCIIPIFSANMHKSLKTSFKRLK